ncbi:MAG TPA: glycosyl hydrolase, partial [Verrucomicrobiae bacterium]
SSSGGPWITPEMSMQRLVWSETKISGGRRVNIALPQPFTRLNFYRDVAVIAFPSLPGEEKPFADFIASIRNEQGTLDKRTLTDGDLDTTIKAAPNDPIVFEFSEPFEARAVTILYTSGGGTIRFTLESSDDGTNFKPVVQLTPASPRAIEDASLVATFAPIRAKYFRVTPSRARGVCEIELHSAPRIPAWNYKANFSFRGARSEDPPEEIAKEFCINRETILDLSDHLDAHGNLNWNAPTGSWTVLRFGHTPRGQENIAAPDAGVGLECDKMNRAAVQFHFEHGLGPLMKSLGSLAGKAFTGLEVDSYEVGVQNWTAGFEREFKQRNGYDLIGYLPEMTGRFVESANTSERFLWDLRRTQAELVANYYYGELRNLCRQHGLRLFVEPYGAGPGAYDELQVAGHADVPMGEFWAHFPWDDMLSIRLAASAAHVNNRTIVGGEAFTSTEEQSRFLDYPFALKTTGDLAFSLGLNQMYFHRFAHQPHPDAIPGMTMGPWGFNFDRNNPWFAKSSGWLTYLARSQFLLQQGNFVADVLYFTGEGSPQMSKRMVPELPPGFTFDAVDIEVLLRDARVEHGQIQLAGGNRYQLLALPDDLKSMTTETLRKLYELVRQGATLVGPKPKFSPTLRNYPESETEVLRLANELWGKDERLEGAAIGKGRVFATEKIADVLKTLKVAPDFEFSGRNPNADIVWLHRHAGDAEIYFIANRQRRAEDILCSFRLNGQEPELWHPENGKLERPVVYDFAQGRTRLPIQLGPAESVFVVFRSQTNKTTIPSLARNGREVLGTDFLLDQSLISRVTNDFTISVWINPGTDMMAMPRESGAVSENGKSWVIPAPDRGTNQPGGPAIFGIAAGRNGVIVAERNGETLSAALVSSTPISGWTHLAVVVKHGKPSLYLNGKLDREGESSDTVVRPGIGIAASPGKTVYYFDGDMTSPTLFPNALEASAVQQIMARGLPPPETPEGIEIENANEKVLASVWSPGNYSLSDGRYLVVSNLPSPIEISGPWRVSFPPDRGAPSEIRLTNLTGLQRLNDPGVRFFSGTAVYRTTFEIPTEALNLQNRFWLDLGRVAVIGEVRVNDRELGNLWRPPFRLEITDAVHAGKNDLEIRVTNLLVNRLIGDENLPAENEYDPRTHAIRRFPEWFVQGEPKPPGGRTTFSTWKFFNAGDPLVESGLLGPVRILTSVSGELK